MIRARSLSLSRSMAGEYKNAGWGTTKKSQPHLYTFPQPNSSTYSCSCYHFSFGFNQAHGLRFQVTSLGSLTLGSSGKAEGKAASKVNRLGPHILSLQHGNNHESSLLRLKGHIHTCTLTGRSIIIKIHPTD
jgi:hypothetical protein